MAIALPITWAPRVSTLDNTWPTNTRLKAGVIAPALDVPTINTLSGLNQIVAEINRQATAYGLPIVPDVSLLNTAVKKSYIDQLIASLKAIRLARNGQVLNFPAAASVTRTLIKNLRNNAVIPVRSNTLLSTLSGYFTQATYDNQLIFQSQFTRALTTADLLYCVNGANIVSRFYLPFTWPGVGTYSNYLNGIATLTLNNQVQPTLDFNVEVFLIAGTVVNPDFFLIDNQGTSFGTFVASNQTLSFNFNELTPGDYCLGVRLQGDEFQLLADPFNHLQNLSSINLSFSYQPDH